MIPLACIRLGWNLIQNGDSAVRCKPFRLPAADTHGLRLAHHAARLGVALAFCDRCPCSVSLYPPQAALDFAAPKGEALLYDPLKAPLSGELAAQRPEGSYPQGSRRKRSGTKPPYSPPETGRHPQKRPRQNTASRRPFIDIAAPPCYTFFG